MSHLEKELERLVADYLLRTSSRGALGNLKEQIIRILRASPEFATLSTGGKRYDWVWGLDEWRGAVPEDGDAGRRSDALKLLRTFEKPRYRPRTRRRPPALRSDDLERFLHELFLCTRVPWSVRDIVYLVADTLGVAEENEHGLVRIGGWGDAVLAEHSHDPAQIVEIRETAESFFNSCSSDDRAMLQALARGASNLAEVAKEVGLSVATVSRRTRTLAERLCESCGDKSSAEAVWDELMALAANA